MAVFLNNKVGIKVNSVDLSDHVTSVTLNRTFDELEVTAMGDTAHKFVKGLEASSVTIDFLNDTAAANVLATLQAAYGTSVTVVLLQDKGTAVSATNPLYTFTCLINNLTDINGAVGDIGTQSVTWTCNSTVAVTTSGTF
ncbi:MAG: radical SAM protein [Micrococcales bacterium]|nr:radical SAM protein [Micrococcales bacterium]